MKFIIKETREPKELNIYDSNGIDWSNDLIGNAGITDAWEYNEEEQAYILPQEDYDWWVDYIAKKQADDNKLAELRKEYDNDEIQKIVDEEFRGINDYEQEHAVMEIVFERIESELKRQ
jgi:hypothetical protein